MSQLLKAREPQTIFADPTQRKLVSVVRGSDVYYSKSSSVSDESNEGSISTAGGPLEVVATTSFVSAGQSRIYVVNLSDLTGQDLATQAELDDATTDIAVVKEAPINVEYPEYGADGTGTTDSLAAFEAAADALPAEGGEIFAPGHYKLTGKLDFDGTRSVRIKGKGALSGGATPASSLNFVMSGSTSAVSARSSAGFCLEDIRLRNENSGSFTGYLLDLSHSESATDEALGVIQRCTFSGGTERSANGVNLNKAILTAFRDCRFSALDVGLLGKKEAADYSNVMTFDNCYFTGTKTIPVKNPGSDWRFATSTFDGLSSGKAGAVLVESGFAARGTKFDTCYFGDVNAEGTWIVWRGFGLSVDSGSMGGGALCITVPVATSEGVKVMGVNFLSTVDCVRLETGVTRYAIGGNGYDTVSGKKVSLDGGSTDAGSGFLADVTKQTALTTALAETIDTTYGEQEKKTIENTRTRVNELETKLKALGYLA